MSRMCEPFSDTGEDAFLPSIEEDGGLYSTCEDFLETENTPVFLSTFDKDLLDSVELVPSDGALAPGNSRTTSVGLTPNHEDTLDFGNYDFEQAQKSASTYPAPDDLSGLCPTHLQNALPIYHKGDNRPLPHRSITTTDVQLAPGPLQTFHQVHNHPSHRRAFSQNDTERILEYPLDHLPPDIHYPPLYSHSQSATTKVPTFMRLCEARHSRPNSKPRADPKKKRPSQNGPAGKSRANTSTSIPVDIGTPLQQDPETEIPATEEGNPCIQLTGPQLVHMPHAEQRGSRKIIELGAILVLNKMAADDQTQVQMQTQTQTIDPLLLEAQLRRHDRGVAPSPEVMRGGAELRDKMLKDLGSMERLLDGGEGEDAEKGRRGCELIREVLARMEDKGGGGEGSGERYVVF